MARRLGILLSSLTMRLLVPLVLTVTAVLAVYAYGGYTATRTQWVELTVNGARRTSELIKRATHYGMLLNRKEDVHHTIRRLADGPGVAGIRLYDKQGAIIFSADEREIGKQVDLQAEACVTCHAEGLAKASVPAEQRSRQFQTPGGHRILGLITPIRNEPECASAACHAHPASQTILGVLDVQMSMDPLETALETSRWQTFWATAAMILIVGLVTVLFVYRVVRRPAQRLYAGTQRVGRGDLDTPIEVGTDDELGRLAGAFNLMMGELRLARSELTNWSEQLEREVARKTEELGRAQRQVVQMEKMASLGKLAATVAHELNNPLAGILNYAKLVQRQIRDEPIDESNRAELERYISLVTKESSRCGNIVRNMLVFARQSGVKTAPEHINEIVERSVMLVRHHLDISGIRLETQYLSGDDQVSCDAGQIQQAILALLMNAVEAMKPQGGGTLSVRLTEANGDLSVDVADTGPGMAPEVVERIFEPFFSTKDQESGVGLGLSVVYGIVQAHGYTIDVESEVGRGTVFRVRLTRVEPQS